jgi:hypothetical protein
LATRLDNDQLLAGKVHYGSDSFVKEVFDNLGYDRKGGPLESNRFETVAQSFKEFQWSDIVRICGQESSDALEMWREKSRSGLSLKSYLKSQGAYEFLDERWATELQDAVIVEGKIAADIGGLANYKPGVRTKFTCRTKVYEIGATRPNTSPTYLAHEIKRQQELVDAGDYLTLHNRNNLEQVTVLLWCMVTCVCT